MRIDPRILVTRYADTGVIVVFGTVSMSTTVPVRELHLAAGYSIEEAVNSMLCQLIGDQQSGTRSVSPLLFGATYGAMEVWLGGDSAVALDWCAMGQTADHTIGERFIRIEMTPKDIAAEGSLRAVRILMESR